MVSLVQAMARSLLLVFAENRKAARKRGGFDTIADGYTGHMPTGVETVEVEAPKDLQEGDVDDLTDIKGIGPAIQTKLRNLGIANFAALAASDPEELVGKLKAWQPISATRVKSWIAAAQDRSAGRK